MQQLILLTGLSEYALKGDGQDYSMPPFTLPQLAFRSTYPEIEYENGQMGHRITVKGDHNLPEHNRYCNMNGNYEFPESLFTWTGVAKNVVTVPDDAKVLADWGQYPPKDGAAEITGVWVDEEPTEREGEEIAAKWMVDPKYPTDIQDISGSMEVARACVLEYGGREAVLPKNAPPMQEAIKNAMLISAAPELYAALKFCVSVMESNGVIELSEIMAVEKANAALAKAVGKGGEND